MSKMKAYLKYHPKLAGILQSCIIFGVIFLGIILFRIYRLNTHGFNTSDDTIYAFLKAYEKQDIYDVEMCYNKQHPTYSDEMNKITTAFTNNPIHLTDDIDIDDNITTFEDMDDVSRQTGLTNIDIIKQNDVTFYSEKSEDNQTTIYEYVWKITTYSHKNKWFVYDFEEQTSDIVDKFYTKDGRSRTVGNKILGKIPVPASWNQVSETDNLTLSFLAQDESAAITMRAEKNTSPENVLSMYQNILSEYEQITENSYLTEDTPAILFMANNKNSITLVYIFENKEYTEVIELLCQPDDVYWYHDNYVKKFAIK